MTFSYRPPTPEDFEACACILDERSSFDEHDLALLPSIWRSLFAGGCMISSVFEDDSASRIVGFGASVFVSDQFVNEVRNNPVPHLSARVIQRALKDNSPVLTPSAIRHANTNEGLNLIVLHHTIARDLLSESELHTVRAQHIRAFLEEHGGYNIKELIAEGLSEEERAWVLISNGGSFHLRSEYDAYYENHPLPPPDKRPFLVGLTRAEALVNEAAVLSPLLMYTKPRFFFREGEQELLQRALLGEVDEELALALSVSLSTVKKRWSAIYERVAAQLPELLPGVLFDDSQKRGLQKRHHLLRYLRQHPEELRPVESSDRPG